MSYQYPFHGKFKYGTEYGVKGSTWKCGWHSGKDYFSQIVGGDGKIHPIAAGKVLANAKNASYGNYITIQHEDGYLSLYAHMAKRSNCSIGSLVNLDTVLGIEGATGSSRAKHTHVEVHYKQYSYPSKLSAIQDGSYPKYWMRD